MPSNRRKFIYNAALGLMVPFVPKAVAVSPYLLNRRKAFLVTGAWYDSFTLASADGSSIWGWNNARISKVVPSVTGNCTKLRARVGNNFTSGATIKLALYDSSRNLINTGATSASIDSSSNQWIEVTISSESVTASTTYYVGSCASTDQIEIPSLSGQTSGDTHVDLSNGYASFPGSPDPFTNSAATYRFAMSMWVE